MTLTAYQKVLDFPRFFGGQGVNRTLDTRIFSPLLYRLSYLPTVTGVGAARLRSVRTLIRIFPMLAVQLLRA
jgi:hypothetical protein